MPQRVPIRRSPTSDMEEEPLPGKTDETQFRMADAGAEMTVILDDSFLRYMETHIRPHPLPSLKPERKLLETHFKTLNCPSVRPALAVIWKRSGPYKTQIGVGKDDPPYLTEKVLSRSLWQAEQDRLNAAFQHARAAGSTLLRLSAGRDCDPADQADDVASQKKFSMRVTRLVKATNAYGLTEEVTVPGQSKPHINGTDRLHEMMLRLGRAQLMLARQALAQIAQEFGLPTEDLR